MGWDLIPNSILLFYFAVGAGWEGGALLTVVAGVSGGENLYLGSSKILINYPALSAAIGGRDGMDGSRSNWMTLPFWEVPSISGSGLLHSFIWFYKRAGCYQTLVKELVAQGRKFQIDCSVVRARY
jgi:hypothetical protein